MLEKELTKNIVVEVEYRDLIVPVNLSLALSEGEKALSFSVRGSEEIEQSECHYSFHFVGTEEWRGAILEKLALQFTLADSVSFQQLRRGWDRDERLPEIAAGVAQLVSTAVVFDAVNRDEELVYVKTEVVSDEVDVFWHLKFAEKNGTKIVIKEGKNHNSVVVLEASMYENYNGVKMFAKSHSPFTELSWKTATWTLQPKENFHFVENDTKIFTKHVSNFFPNLTPAFERLKEIVRRHSGLAGN